MAHVGGDVESYCSPCKMMILHTVEAMVGGTPKRVQCNSCHAQHVYKAAPPGTRKAATGRRTSTTGSAKARASDYEKMMEGRSSDDARRYSPKGVYQKGEIIQHPTFGTGVTLAIKESTKIEVLFHDGPRVLIHARG